MGNEEQLKEFFQRRNQEASWCYSCARRNTCKDKEIVSFEEMIINKPILKFVNVKAECIGYIKDSSVKVDLKRDFFGRLFN